MASPSGETLTKVSMDDLYVSQRGKARRPDTIRRLLSSLTQDHFCSLKLNEQVAEVLKHGLKQSALIFDTEARYRAENSSSQRDQDTKEIGGYQQLLGKELYDVIPGTGHEPLALNGSFMTLKKICQQVLEALAWALRVPPYVFDDLLDNEPLPPGAVSSSMLTCLRYKVSVKKEDEKRSVTPACPAHVDKGLLTLIASDKAGLEVFSNDRWQAMEATLGQSEIIVLPGQALFEATAGLIEAAQHRVMNLDHRTRQACQGRVSLAFKCRPRQEATFDRSILANMPPAIPTKFGTTFSCLSVQNYLDDFDAKHASVNKPSVKRERSNEKMDVNSPPIKAAKGETHMSIVVKGQDGSEVVFKVSRNARIKKLYDRMATRVGNDLFRLLFNGFRLDSDKSETFKDYGLEDWDYIDMIVPQCGD